MRTSLRRLALGSGVIALLVGSAFIAVPTAAEARPAAAKLDGLSFDPARQTLKSTTHKKLQVSLFAAVTNELNEVVTSAGFTVTRKGVPETHNWNFKLTKGSLAYNPTTGKGSLKTGKQLSPYATLSLKFHNSGKGHTTTCKTEKTVDQTVSVKGSLSFDTRSGKHGWGKVTTKHLSGKTIIVYETGTAAFCGGGAPLPCSSGIEWDVFHAVSGSVDESGIGGTIYKVGSKTVRTLFSNRNTALSKPKGAVRGDETTIVDSHMTFAVDGGNKATLQVSGTGPVKGSATLTSPAAGETFPPESCGKASQQETSTTWAVAYTNGKSPLAVHEQIEGTYKLPNMASNGENSINKSVVS